MKTKQKSPQVERTYKKKISYKCPVRGLVTQEVVVQVFRTPEPEEDLYVDPEIIQLLRDHNMDDLEENGFHEVEEP